MVELEMIVRYNILKSIISMSMFFQNLVTFSIKMLGEFIVEIEIIFINNLMANYTKRIIV